MQTTRSAIRATRAITWILLLIPVVIGLRPAIAQPVLVDDFSSTTIDFTKYRTLSNNDEVESVTDLSNGVLLLQTTTGPDGEGETILRSVSIDPVSMQGDLAVLSVSLGSSDDSAVVRVEGEYYNAASADPLDRTGDVFVSARLGDRGNGFQEAFWVMLQFVNSRDVTVVGSGDIITDGSLAIGTPYTARIDYDGDRTFTFTVNGISSGAVLGPPRMGEPDSGFQGFKTLVLGEGAIQASIDNVNINNGDITDDFSGGP